MMIRERMRIGMRTTERLGCRRPRRALGGVLVLAVIGGWLMPEPALAQLQRVEAVGSYGIHERMRARVTPRDEAVQKAIWEGVSRVALEEIGGLASTEEDMALLKTALGKDMLPYTRSFRILEDKGESPVLFEEDPDVSTEYIVVVEVLVDVARVKSVLVEAGMIQDGEPDTVGETVIVELVGIGRHDTFESVRSAIVSELGASRVETLGFAHERQLLSVVGPLGPRELSAALARLDEGSWSLEPVGIDEIGRRVRVRGRIEP
jgi:hypothetical protein